MADKGRAVSKLVEASRTLSDVVGPDGDAGARGAALAQRLLSTAFATLEEIMTDRDAPHSARVAAAKEVNDRALGKSAQSVTSTSIQVDGNEAFLRALEGFGSARSGMVIEHDPS